jgi:hypothetical protein
MRPECFKPGTAQTVAGLLFYPSGNRMKKVIAVFMLAFACVNAHAQFTVIRGVNPSNAFTNLNSDQFGNIAVNCVIGCGASSGTAGVIANGAATAGINPLLVGGSDGTSLRTLNTDASGHQNINVINTPSVTLSGTLPAFASTPAVSLSGTLPAFASTPAVTISGTPSVTVSGTATVSGAVTATDQASNGTLTNLSGSITTGGTSQTLSTAKSRKYFFVQNLSSANLYINFTSAASAAAGSILLLPNASFVMEGTAISSELITVFGATTGQAFTAKEF